MRQPLDIPQIVCENTHSIAIFNKDVVVAAYGNQEEYDVDIIEDVDPFLTLGPLPTHVEHAVGQASGFEDCLTDACCA